MGRPSVRLLLVDPRLPFHAILFDIEGTLLDGDRAVPGAAAAVDAVRSAGMHVRFVTNTTRLPREGLARRLDAAGISAGAGELFTAVTAAAAWGREAGRTRVLPLRLADALGDLEDREGVPPQTADAPDGESRVGAVVVGDLGRDWTYAALESAFRCLLGGAELVACQKNRYWRTPEGLALDAGPFVAALEYASGREATLVGKPTPAFFAAALAACGVPPARAIVVGDDAEVDVAGAIAAGLSGWLVRTGKYRPGDETRYAPWPECVLGSVAELPKALGL